MCVFNTTKRLQGSRQKKKERKPNDSIKKEEEGKKKNISQRQIAPGKKKGSPTQIIAKAVNGPSKGTVELKQSSAKKKSKGDC